MADLESDDLDKSGLSTWLWYSGPAVFVLGSLALAGLGIFAGSALLAAAPALACVSIAWWLDRNEREPLRLLAITFLWGALPAAGAALFLSAQLDFAEKIAGTFAGALIVAPVIEEWVKSIGVRRVADNHRHEFDGLLDGLIYGSVVGFGFGMTEDILYLVSAYAEGGKEAWLGTAFARGVVFVTGHAAYSACFGAALGLARYAESQAVRRWAPAVGLVAAMALHSLHNLLVSGALGETWPVAIAVNWTTNLVWLGLVAWAVRRESRWIGDALRPEVHQGVMLPSHARAAGSYRARLYARRLARRAGPDRARLLSELHVAAAELALALRRKQVEGENRTADEKVQRLREQCSRITRALEAEPAPVSVTARKPAA